MSSRESRAVIRGSVHKRSQSKESDIPSMRDATPLRIVLLGKSVSENSRVGNFILGRSVFDSEAPPDVVERVGGRLKHRRVILINSPQLLHTNISDHQITQTARECVSLSDPGPHVVLLLLQHEQCSAEDQERVEKLLDSFSERLLQHSMVLSTQEPTETNEILQKIIHKCSNRHFSLQRSSSPDDLLQALEDIEQSNEGRHLLCAQYKAFTEEKQRYGERLNVVVCGSDGSLKSSISELIQQQTHRRSESVRTDVDLLLNVLELPALFNTGLSEEEVMRQTLRCVSLCHPGVHAFLLIIPDAPLNNQDRAEMEEIKRIFSSRINKHLMILIKQNSEHQTAELNDKTRAVIESFGGRHHFCGPKTQVSTLMENIEQMLEENRGGFFSTETFLEAQMKKLMKYEEMKRKIHSLETHLLTQDSRVNTDDEVRIVLLGKTGVGKSTTGNTILGRTAFTAETSHQSVTKASQRESGEISGRQVTVIDTPGLFDTELTNKEIQTEIRHCISMILPGAHVFIIVLSLGQRFTKEEETAVKIIQETFGENSLMFTMVLFTRGDDLGNKTIEEYLGKPGSPLMNLIEACGNRFHVFNNNQTEDQTQVSDLLEKIDNIVKANRGSFYSCKMFREMERERQEQQMKILMDRVREAEEEMKKLMMMMEEERQNHETEKKRREEELKREIREEEKHQREIREQMKRERETFRHEIEEMRKEKEKIKTEKDNLRTEYQTETDRLMNRIENERHNHETERKRREEEFRENQERYKKLMKEREEKMQEEMKREKEKDITHDDLRIVLLGKTGDGKSASGNTILRRPAFKSMLKSRAVTRECQKEKAEFSRRRITVIDTPGLFDTGVNNVEIRKEIVKCVSMAAPGPHVFLLVIQLGRVTKEVKDAVKMIQEMFGDQSRMYTIVLFTKGDQLKEEQTIEDFIEDDDSLTMLVHQCEERYHVFNNETEDQTQVSELLDKIDCMVVKNRGTFYTNEMFQQNIREEQERIMKEKEEEIKRKEEELKDKYEAEIEQMKNKNERERKEMQDELRKSKEEFKKKEEEIKKEKDESLQKELRRKLEEQQKQFEKENRRKEKALGEQQDKFLKFLEEQHKKDKQELKERIQKETREQAEREFCKRAEEKLAYRAKYARDWGAYVPVLGAPVGEHFAAFQDIYAQLFGR